MVRCVAPLSIKQASELDKDDAKHRRAYSKPYKKATVKVRQQKPAHGPLRNFTDVSILTAVINVEDSTTDVEADFYGGGGTQTV